MRKDKKIKQKEIPEVGRWKERYKKEEKITKQGGEHKIGSKKGGKVTCSSFKPMNLGLQSN